MCVSVKNCCMIIYFNVLNQTFFFFYTQKRGLLGKASLIVAVNWFCLVLLQHGVGVGGRVAAADPTLLL